MTLMESVQKSRRKRVLSGIFITFTSVFILCLVALYFYLDFISNPRRAIFSGIHFIDFAHSFGWDAVDRPEFRILRSGEKEAKIAFLYREKFNTSAVYGLEELVAQEAIRNDVWGLRNELYATLRNGQASQADLSAFEQKLDTFVDQKGSKLAGSFKKLLESGPKDKLVFNDAELKPKPASDSDLTEYSGKARKALKELIIPPGFVIFVLSGDKPVAVSDKNAPDVWQHLLDLLKNANLLVVSG